MPVDCTGNLTADILFDCANAPIGGIEQNVVLINKDDIDLSATTVDATNRILLTNLQLKPGKTGYLLTGVKQANGTTSGSFSCNNLTLTDNTKT